MSKKMNCIKLVKLENFRCYKKLILNFDNCHALIGENGAGKTAILEAINLATSPNYVASRIDEQDFNMADEGNIIIEVEFKNPFINRIPDGYTVQNIPCDKIRLEIKRRERAAPGKALSEPFVVEHYSVPIIYNKFQKLDIEDVPEYIKQTEEGYCAPRKNGKTICKFTKLQLNLQNDLVDLPIVFYFNRDRENESRTGFNTLFQRIVKDLNWRYRKAWNQEISLELWENYYNDVINNISDSNLNKLISSAKNKLEEFTGDSYSLLEISLINIEQPFSKAFFALRSQTNQIDSDNFGSGISVLFSFLLLEEMAKISKQDIVLLIDEPELHLHSQLQQQIFKHFQSANHQTIYTTQSDCLLDLSNWHGITRVSHIHYCYPIQEKLEICIDEQTLQQHLDDIKNFNLHKKIFYREHNQIFFARKCLLVEGPNDRYGIPIVAEKINISLNGLTIIMCGGKNNIKHYQVLCLAFDIPFFTIFDKDNHKQFPTSKEKQANDAENLRIEKLCQNNNCYSFKSSFETLLNINNKRTFFERLKQLQAKDIPAEMCECLNALNIWLNN